MSGPCQVCPVRDDCTERSDDAFACCSICDCPMVKYCEKNIEDGCWLFLAFQEEGFEIDTSRDVIILEETDPNRHAQFDHGDCMRWRCKNSAFCWDAFYNNAEKGVVGIIEETDPNKNQCMAWPIDKDGTSVGCNCVVILEES